MCVTNPVRKRNAMKARNDAARIHSLVRETEMRISDSVD